MVNSAPIPVGPVLICPVVELDLIFGVDGKLGFSAEVTYSKEFMVGVAYQNSQLSSYGSVVEQETGKSPWGFAPKVQLEGGISIGVAPCLDFSLWKITTIGTRLNNLVKISANLNFDLSSPLFDPSLYNAFSNSKVSAQLEMYLDGSLRVWSKTIADTKSTTLQYPLYEAYFVPKLENFAIIGKRAKMNIELDISNSLVFKSEIGMNFYEKDPKTGKFTVEAGTMKLCEYSKPPAGKKVYNLKKEEKTNLPPGKEYEARLTVALDAPGGPYTLETDVKTRFTIPDDAIILTTTKNTGEKIKLLIDAEYSDKKDVWIDLNNNGKRDNGEEVVFGKSENYTLGSKTFSIYGKVSTLWCGNTQLTLLDVSTCKSLRDLSCSMNQLTSLDVSKSTRLQYLHCDDNQLTSLDVSGFTELLWLSCDENQLTSLDVSGCTKLSNLNCWKNKITSLNTSSCKVLGSLLCYDNQLITLDASGCAALKDLECHDNQLVTLNISGCTALIKLLCYNNQITSLDVSSSAKLQHLRCENNQITSLDVSGFVELLRLSCAKNQLTSLDVSGCTALKFLDCSENKLTTLDASSCSLNDFDCKNNDLTGIVPDYFQYITFISYDIRYVYVLVQVSENEWETVSVDSGKGYWYAHEPESGCHRPEPCK